MSIQETIDIGKDGEPVPRGPRALFQKLFLALVILLTGALGFGIGRLTAGQVRGGVEIKMDPSALNDQGQMTNVQSSANGLMTNRGVYASSKGTKYYYPNCKSSVSEANRVTFATAAMAEAAGYTLAANCSKP